MCLIIRKPYGATVPQWILNEAAQDNPHGTGTLVITSKRVTARKALDVKSERKVLAHANRSSVESWFHFRLATSGSKDHLNCHPVTVPLTGRDARDGYRIWIMHNGIFSGLGDAKRSDTCQFAEMVGHIIGSNPRRLFKDAMIREAVERMGSGSKYVFVDSEGRSLICHESEWKTFNKLLVSNTYFQCGGRYAYDGWEWDTAQGAWKSPPRTTTTYTVTAEDDRANTVDPKELMELCMVDGKVRRDWQQEVSHEEAIAALEAKGFRVVDTSSALPPYGSKACWDVVARSVWSDAFWIRTANGVRCYTGETLGLWRDYSLEEPRPWSGHHDDWFSMPSVKDLQYFVALDGQDDGRTVFAATERDLEQITERALAIPIDGGSSTR